ncbi:MAG: hypothetical protein AAB946_01915, partial [Patescibacteria group bacterium]
MLLTNLFFFDRIQLEKVHSSTKSWFFEKLPFWDYLSQEKDSEVKSITIEEALKKGFIKSQAYGWCILLAYTQFVSFGIPSERIRLRQHHPDEKAFYAD